MSTATKSPRRKTTAAEGVVPNQRKKEILGLLVMVLAFLTLLAIVSYSISDLVLVRDATFGETVLEPGAQRARNALGLLGAMIAHALVPSFIGYPILLPILLVLAWGYVIFRSRRPAPLPLFSAVVIVSAFVTSCLFGWFSISLERDLLVWSGVWGAGVAEWMQRVFGATGSLIILIFVQTAATLVALERDIQRLVERVERAAAALRERVSAWIANYRASRAEQRAARMEDLNRWDEPEPEAEAQTQRLAAPPPAPLTPPLEAPPASRRRSERREAPPTPVEDLSEKESLTLRSMFREAAISPPPLPEPRPRSAPPAPRPKPVADEGPTLKVQQRVEEEKADFIDRPTDIPLDEDQPYTFPPIDLLDEADADEQQIDYQELEENKRVLLEKLETYKIEIIDINAIVGPTVTLYELTPAPGVKISRITALEDDLAMAMAARGIRMIAPIPGKSAIGVEIPNRHREFVRIRDLIATARFRDNKMELPIAIGKTVEGEVFIEDLTKMPHLLIAGATGSGKSVGVNTLIASLLYSCHPGNLKFVMIDPKKIELQQYARIVHQHGAMPPDLEQPIITDFTQALGVLKSCEKEMERRYDMLSKSTVRGIKDYNKKVQSGQLKAEDGHEHLPYIVVIVDELADLMMTAGKDIEGPIARLAQMARAVGIHLVLATQRPSVDVITGLIKANFPSRIAYQVASKVDSRTILDQNGAEGLVGNGDLLYMNGSRLIRLQAPFLSVDEVDEITTFIEHQPGPGPFMLPSVEHSVEPESREIEVMEDIDDLFDEAARIIVRSQQGSVSLLQRKLSVGYTRAARIVDQLEEAGIVGPFEGSKARQVLLESEIQLDEMLAAQKQQDNQER